MHLIENLVCAKLCASFQVSKRNHIIRQGQVTGHKTSKGPRGWAGMLESAMRWRLKKRSSNSGREGTNDGLKYVPQDENMHGRKKKEEEKKGGVCYHFFKARTSADIRSLDRLARPCHVMCHRGQLQNLFWAWGSPPGSGDPLVVGQRNN